MSEGNIQTLREQFEALFRHRDIDGAVSPYAEDATITDHALGQTISGVAELREYYRQQLGFSSDQQVDIKVVDAGEWTIAYGTLHGTHDGPFGPIEATNKTVDNDYCNITRWENGKIVEDHIYYDLHSIFVQMDKATPLTQG